MLEEALEIATDADYKFDLAVQLGKLDVAKVLIILSLIFFLQIS
jgi:coatomer subunit beta'